MTDYNDGKWHGWNGGECPVHPDSEIQTIYDDLSGTGVNRAVRAGALAWEGDCIPCVFRVTKAYVEPPKPREFWINVYQGKTQHLHVSAEAAKRGLGVGGKTIHVREVQE